jgi:hypothetical protein
MVNRIMQNQWCKFNVDDDDWRGCVNESKELFMEWQ